MSRRFRVAQRQDVWVTVLGWFLLVPSTLVLLLLPLLLWLLAAVGLDRLSAVVGRPYVTYVMILMALSLPLTIGRVLAAIGLLRREERGRRLTIVVLFCTIIMSVAACAVRVLLPISCDVPARCVPSGPAVVLVRGLVWAIIYLGIIDWLSRPKTVQLFHARDARR